MIRDCLNGNVALKLQPQIVGRRVGTNFLPLVLDDRAGLDAGKRKRLRAQLQTARFHDRLLDDVRLRELDDRTVRLDRARGDILDLDAVEVRDVDLAVLLTAALVEDLDAHVMGENEIVLAAVVDANVPKDRFCICVWLDDRCLEREIGRLDRTPILARGQARAHRTEWREQKSDYDEKQN